MKRRLAGKNPRYIFILLLLCPVFIFADKGEFRFDQLTIHEGLSQGTVVSILQDRYGFLWFGTKEGLNRYDGIDFKIYTYDSRDVHSLSYNIVTRLCQDRQGNLWVGTQRGLNRFNIQSDRFTRFYAGEGRLLNNNILSLACDQSGDTWVGTADGLQRYQAASDSFVCFGRGKDDSTNLSGQRITALLAENPSHLWVGTDRGLNLLNPKNGRIKKVRIPWDSTNSETHHRITTLHLYQPGQLWVGTEERVLVFDAATSTFLNHRGQQATPANTLRVGVKTIINDRLGRIWVGSNGGGVYIIEQKSGKVIQCTPDSDHSRGLSDNLIHSLYMDHSGVIWLGTGGYGLNKWAPEFNRFSRYLDEPGPMNRQRVMSVRAIFEDPRGLLWVGGYGGIYRIDRTHGRYTFFSADEDNPQMISAANVRALCEDPIHPGRVLWVGFENGNINKFDVSRGICLKRYTGSNSKPGAPTGTIYTMIKGKGKIWIGSNRGLTCLQLPREEFKSYFHPHQANWRIYSLSRSKSGKVWLGTEKNGIHYLDMEREQIFPLARLVPQMKPESIRSVLSLYQDQQERLWVGTNGGGLFSLDLARGAMVQYTTGEGLPNNVIYGILEDSQRHLWLSTNRGLARLHKASGEIRNYYKRDGLQSDEFNLGAWYKSRSGEMFFGGVSGLNAFVPENIEDNQNLPRTVLTDLEIFNRSVSIGQYLHGRMILDRALHTASNLRLSYKDNVITFRFAALHFVAPDKNRYAVQMEGFEQDWNHIGNRRFVTYTSLPPGHYTFRVKGSNNDGIWQEEGSRLEIYIIPPFWLTWWFWGFVIVLLIALSGLLFKIRTAKIRQHNIQLQESNIVLNREIAERKKIEKALIESEKNYRTLFVSIPDPILIFHQENHRILDCNQAALDRLGYSRQELGQMTPFDLHAPADSPTGTIVINQPRQHILLTRDKKQLQVEVHTSEVDYRSEKAYVAIIRDVTLQKQLEQELNQAQKMESIGKLAGGIAHDFNNLLTAMLGHAELALMKMIKDSPLEKDIRAILNSGQRASGLISQLLAFSRKQLIKPVVLNVNELIGELKNMLMRLIGEDITISAQLKPGILNIKADPVQVEQILINLIINARDAIREHNSAGSAKKITLKTDQVTLDDRFVEGHLEVHSGCYIVISVSDTGIGMDEATKKQIFDPFFTTKGESEGTGLGMSTVYGIVKQNRGSIYVYSEPDRGTTIKIYWPASTEKLKGIKSEKLSAAAAAKFQTVLVVEDDKNVRDFTLAALQELDYDVTACATGVEAMALVENQGRSFDLLITDLIMPEMNGRELSEKLAAKFPQMKIIITSGYPDRHLNQLQDLPPGVQFLAKPYSIHALVEIINSISA